MRATLARHLGHGDTGDEAELRRGRRYAVAAPAGRPVRVVRRAAAARWSPTGSTAATPTAAAATLDADLAWQPELWRRLVDRGRRAAAARAPRRRPLARLRDEPEAFDLPPRLSLFGHTRLPVTEIELLDALAAHRDVHLWLPHPSAALWDALAEPRRRRRPRRRRQPPAGRAPAAGHASAATAASCSGPSAAVPADDRRTTPMPAAPGHPARLAPARPARRHAPRPTGRGLADGDRCVQVHACHGAARQVDVLREVLLGLLEDDPTLEPRDILVMCPDIETYAPLITAGFGLGDVVGAAATRPTGCGSGSPTARSAQTNPLLGVAAQLLDLAGGRATGQRRCSTSPQAEPVRRRFGFTDDDLDQLDRLGRASPACGGRFDAEHRDAVRPGRLRRRTPGEFGLDRLLTGVAMSDDSSAWLDRALPLDDVGSSAGRPGRPARRVRRPAARRDRPAHRHPPARPTGWTALDDGVAALTARRVATTAGSRPGAARARPGRRATPPTSARRRPAAARRPRAARPTGSPAARPGPTSAPARSPSARWCRCARCRTGWSACSASTTGCSRGRARSTATTCSPATR